MKLTKKQERFCQRYLIDFNATKSAMAIGYSKKTARQTGYELLTKPYIQDYISKLRKEMEEKFDVTRESMLQFLFTLRDFDIRKLYDKDGNLKAIHTLDDDTAMALASVDTDEIREFDPVSKSMESVGLTRKVKAHNKIQAAQEINRMLGYGSTVKISGTGTDEKGNTIKEFKVTLNL